ncbi:hypothetical protein NCS52_01311900 [Fusarium sp. LHS14.1]|nr:hypothetical protein NCS52_01311900 [Fusarium sp. LHS14.1]
MATALAASAGLPPIPSMCLFPAPTIPLCFPSAATQATAPDPFSLQSFPSKPRVFILSDISNEPDDAESLVRYLLYSNQFETEGLVATTSTWMKEKVHPEDMHAIIDAYSAVVDNLNNHTHPGFLYPSTKHWRSIIKAGTPAYGLEGVGEDRPLSEGGQLLLDRIIARFDEPLWVLIWGGSCELAQVLVKIRSTFPSEEAAALRAKLRVYAISDQDDTGAWIRANFPDLFYISSVHAWNQYSMATWSGISGERYFGFDQDGPDFTKVSKEWIRENIQLGPLGSAYPDYAYIAEGDTPSFLYLIQNGLGVPEHPESGSWGGRYQLTNTGHNHSSHYGDVIDIVVGQDGKTYTSNQATIWRWRDAYQNDFAARIQWTLSPSLSAANHHPVIIINGSSEVGPLFVDVKASGSLILDANGSYDPDGDTLEFRWWQYREPSASQWPILLEVAELSIEGKDSQGKVVQIRVPPLRRQGDQMLPTTAKEGQLLHVILEVTDSGSPRLTSYRRVIIRVSIFTIDWIPVLTFVVWNLVNVPPNFLWQEFMESAFPAHQTNPRPTDATKTGPTNSRRRGQGAKPTDHKTQLNVRNTIIKVLLDNSIGSAVNSLLFVSFMTSIKFSMDSSTNFCHQHGQSPTLPIDGVIDCGKPDWNSVRLDMCQEFISILTAGWKFWPVVSLVNFTMVESVQARNLVSGLAGLAWGIYVSLLLTED